MANIDIYWAPVLVQYKYLYMRRVLLRVTGNRQTSHARRHWPAHRPVPVPHRHERRGGLAGPPVHVEPRRSLHRHRTLLPGNRPVRRAARAARFIDSRIARHPQGFFSFILYRNTALQVRYFITYEFYWYIVFVYW